MLRRLVEPWCLGFREQPVVDSEDARRSAVRRVDLRVDVLDVIGRGLRREQVARVNICRFCTDIGRWFSIQESMNQARFDALEQYRTSALFTDAERAALALTEAATRINDRSDPVSDEVWNEAAKYYSEQELATLVLNIGMINLWNRLNVATRQVAGYWEKAAEAQKSAQVA